MIKRALLLLTLFAFALGAKAQNLPTLKVTQISANGVSNFPDTIYQGQFYTLSITVANLSNNITYVNDSNKIFSVFMQADSTLIPFSIYNDTALFTIAPGGIITFVAIDSFSTPQLKLGNNVVVVWPSVSSSTGSSINTDSTYFATYFVGISGIENVSNTNTLIYPNPFSESITILKENDTRMQLFIFDETGRLVYQNPVDKKSYDLSFLKQGLYFVELRKANTVVAHKKLVKL